MTASQFHMGLYLTRRLRRPLRNRRSDVDALRDVAPEQSHRSCILSLLTRLVPRLRYLQCQLPDIASCVR